MLQRNALLGIDWGGKRIGIAFGDTTDKIAVPLKIVLRSPWKNASREIKSICVTRNISNIILGWPKFDRVSKRWGMIRSAIGLLKEEGFPEVILQDESETSHTAQDISKQLFTKQRYYDHYAAAIILQDYLENI